MKPRTNSIPKYLRSSLQKTGATQTKSHNPSTESSTNRLKKLKFICSTVIKK